MTPLTHKQAVRKWLTAEERELCSFAPTDEEEGKIFGKFKGLLASILPKVREFRFCEPGDIKCALVLGFLPEVATNSAFDERHLGATLVVAPSGDDRQPPSEEEVLRFGKGVEEATHLQQDDEASEDLYSVSLEVRLTVEGEKATLLTCNFLRDFPGAYVLDDKGRPLLCANVRLQVTPHIQMSGTSGHGVPMAVTLDALRAAEGNAAQLQFFFATGMPQ